MIAEGAQLSSDGGLVEKGAQGGGDMLYLYLIHLVAQPS